MYQSRKHPQLNEFFNSPWSGPEQHDYQFSLSEALELIKTCVKCGKRPVELFTTDQSKCVG